MSPPNCPHREPDAQSLSVTQLGHSAAPPPEPPEPLEVVEDVVEWLVSPDEQAR